jgi:hypothetical protein
MIYNIVIVTFIHFVLSVHAHFVINIPEPIKNSAVKDPLNPSGSDFPCHGADLTNPTTRTTMAVGNGQPLRFDLDNTAVHEGGSCQISITYETDLEKVRDPANWKVIKSFIGGCPTDWTGNLEEANMCNGSNSPKCINNLSFDIPYEVKSGNATMSWTWFNNVGNHEMYMNCAAVTFTGGYDRLNTLPDIFIANLNNTLCTTEEYSITLFPNPGKYIEVQLLPNYPLKLPFGTGCGFNSIIPNLAATIINTSSPEAKNSSYIARCTKDKLPCTSSGLYCFNSTTYGQCTHGCATPRHLISTHRCANNRIVASLT